MVLNQLYIKIIPFDLFLSFWMKKNVVRKKLLLFKNLTGKYLHKEITDWKNSSWVNWWQSQVRLA